MSVNLEDIERNIKKALVGIIKLKNYAQKQTKEEERKKETDKPQKEKDGK